MQPLTPADVQAALDQLNTGIQIRFFENSTATSQQAADNIGCELGQIVKSLAFIIDEKPIIVLASGDQRVDDKKLAAIYNVGAKKSEPLHRSSASKFTAMRREVCRRWHIARWDCRSTSTIP